MFRTLAAEYVGSSRPRPAIGDDQIKSQLLLLNPSCRAESTGAVAFSTSPKPENYYVVSTDESNIFPSLQDLLEAVPATGQ